MTSAPPPVVPPPPSGGSSGLPSERWTHRIFLGPSGMRAGWRILIACALWAVFVTALSAVLLVLPSFRALLKSPSIAVITPVVLFFNDGLPAAALLLAAFVMTRIEKRSFADYGLPGREAFGKRFWQGILYGLVMVSLLMVLIAALHGFSLAGLALHGRGAAQYAVLYLVGFILVALFEEFSFRGYLQAALGSGIGFWPAALILAAVFGAIHLGNSGEAAFGAVTAGAFGLLCAFSLRRTGTLWFAIGLHAAWDWGETYFYSVPDSGAMATGHLMNSTFRGPHWLTGGTVGPEASVFTPVVLALAAVTIHFIFPAHRKPV